MLATPVIAPRGHTTSRCLGPDGRRPGAGFPCGRHHRGAKAGLDRCVCAGSSPGSRPLHRSVCRHRVEGRTADVAAAFLPKPGLQFYVRRGPDDQYAVSRDDLRIQPLFPASQSIVPVLNWAGFRADSRRGATCAPRRAPHKPRHWSAVCRCGRLDGNGGCLFCTAENGRGYTLHRSLPSVCRPRRRFRPTLSAIDVDLAWDVEKSRSGTASGVLNSMRQIDGVPRRRAVWLDDRRASTRARPATLVISLVCSWPARS